MSPTLSLLHPKVFFFFFFLQKKKHKFAFEYKFHPEYKIKKNDILRRKKNPYIKAII